MFTIILSLVATLMHAYVTWRLGSLSWFNLGHHRQGLWLASLGIWLVYMVGVRLSHGAVKGLPVLLEQLALDWLGILFIATSVMLGLDLLTGFGLWGGRYLDRLRMTGCGVAAILVVVAFIQGSRPPVVTQYEIPIRSLPPQLDGTRLVLLSDLHLGSQFGAKWLSARVSQVETLKPDIIVLVGDIFEGHGTTSPNLKEVFTRLKAPLGVYAVTGNHESFGGSETNIAMSEEAGVQWLRNRIKVVAPGLILAGVDDLTHIFRNGDEVDAITPVLKDRPEGATILLSHSPLQTDYASQDGVDLMLSGHTHNGQIWPFNYLVQHFYHYMTGKHRIGDMTLIIGRGAGLWGPRMRLWNPGEIIEITLRKVSSTNIVTPAK